MHSISTPSLLAVILAGLPVGLGAMGQQPQGPGGTPAATGPLLADNPYRLQPFHADFPAVLEYPNRSGLEYGRTRRQALERVVANLQGNARREAWLMAMEFFWNGPEEAVEPLVEAMDRAFGKPLDDVVKNCVEAMGKMANEGLDPALQRALEHKNSNVRQAALTALATSGKLTTLRNLFQLFPQMDARSRTAWLRAARLRLGAEAVPLLRQLMMAPYHPAVRQQVLTEALLLPAAQAAEVLRGRWAEAQGELKATIAGVLHAAGDTSGTAWLRDVLQGEDQSMLTQAIPHCAFAAQQQLGDLRDSVLRLSNHPRAEVRHEVAKVLAKLDGDDIAAVFESLAVPEETVETRSIALRELTRRGRTQFVTSMLEELATATGTRQRWLLNQLATSGDLRGVPVFLERFEKAPAGEGRPFVQAMALARGDAATAGLLQLFLGPVRLIDRGDGKGDRFTTLNYVPTMLLNLRGSEHLIVTAFQQLPREDWLRRAALLPTLVGIVSDRDDPALREACLPLVRGVLFDREELPQLRVLALNLLTRRYLTIDDAMRLQNGRPAETPAFRLLLADFLNDYF